MKNTKKVAVYFVLDGLITGPDEFTFLRIQKMLRTTFPAAKIADMKVMSLIEEPSQTPLHES